MKNNLKRVMISFICFLLIFSTFSSFSGISVSAQEEKLSNEDDTTLVQDEDLILELPLKVGDEGEQIKVLKYKLSLAGYLEDLTDDYFDEELKDSLIEFQQEAELEVTGKYDEKTSETLDEYLRSEIGILFMISDVDEEISEWKVVFTQVGYGLFPEDPSSIFGPVTKSVVEEFQEDQELEITGALDNETVSVLTDLTLEEGQKESEEDLKREDPTSEEENVDSEDTEDQEINAEVEEQENESDTSSNTTMTIMSAEESIGLGKVTASNSLRVRSGPSTSYDVIGSLSNGDEVELLSEHDGWYKIVYEQSSTSAYASSAYIQLMDEASETDPLTLPYQNGDEGEEIKTMKMKLTELGFGHFSSDASKQYDQHTMGVVEEFQDYYGLNGDGIADQETMDRISSELTTIYRDGQADGDIVVLKEKLTLLGYGNFPDGPSNRYGPVTTGVVLDFQRAENLKENGIGDSVTMAMLEKRVLEEDRYFTVNLTLPYSDGDSGEEIQQLKKDLTTLGFGNFPSVPSDRYGPVTMGIVKDFQRYYSLHADGITGQATINRISSELNTTYRDGQAHRDIVTLKEDLTRLGYGNFPDGPSNRYGQVTEGVVSEFQRAENLVVNALGDSVTMKRLALRMNEFYNVNLSLPYQDGDVGDDIIELKKGLTTLGFGNFPSDPSNRYGRVTMGVVSEFQSYYGLNETGVSDQLTMEQLQQELNSSYRDGQANNEIVQLKENLTTLGYGNFPDKPSNRYGPVTAGIVLEFQKSQGLVENGIGDSVTIRKIQLLLPDEEVIGKGITTAVNGLNVRSGPSTSHDTVGIQLPFETEVNLLKEMENGWYRISHSSITTSPAYVSGFYINIVRDGLILPYQHGDEGEEIREMKKNLTKLGFGNFANEPSNRYDSVTKGVVEEFQAYYDLSVTGKVSQSTFDYINEVLSSSYRLGQSHAGVVELKKNLKELGFGSFPSNPTPMYGEKTEKVVKEFQKYHSLAISGIADSVTLTKINAELDKISGSDYDRNYNMTLEEMVDKQMTLGPQTDLYGGGWQNAKREDVKFYLDPNNFILDSSSRDMYQFLVLSQTSGVSGSQLNNILSNKGILHNTGYVFRETAERNNVNDIYLISHALLETGHGTSILSNGSIKVGEVSNNKWVTVLPADKHDAKSQPKKYILERIYNERNGRWSWLSNRNDNFDTSKINLKKTYNMFGIEAIDSAPYTRGSVRAFREGWFSPEAAIEGGAQFISNNYFERGQDTLYKMRWDPDLHEAAANSRNIGRSSFYQYATDIGWAWKQTRMIKQLYDQIETPYLPFEVPRYEE